MNEYAIFHKSESNYCYAFARDTLTVTLRVSAKDKFEKVEILYNNKYDFIENRFTAQMKRCATDGIFAYYRANISLKDRRFAYIFKLYADGREYYFSEDGLSENYDLPLAYYTFFQFAYVNQTDVMPIVEWAKDAVFYQIFIDRFCRGDITKDDKYVNVPWDGTIDRYSFAGGDLQGITEKLDYLKNLGINALYLTPIFLSKSNHKYNVEDYLQVDPQFGNRQTLLNLLKEAHARGMKAVIDTVFNHCDVNHAIFADVCKKGRASKYYDWFLIDGDKPDLKKGNFAQFAHCANMPKWNTGSAQVRRYLIDVALEYLKMGFDGLRLDVADEISHEMWRQLRREVKEKYPQALILGEIWHDNEQWLKGDQLDGVMNYKLQKILVDYFGTESITAENASDRMNRLLFANTMQANAHSLNFLDNHDTPRFARFTGGNCDRLLGALCAVVMFAGMPCIFYGTELPLDGAGDPDCRKTFDWTFKNQDKTYADNFSGVLALKKQKALSGTQTEVSAEDGILKIARICGGESVTAYFNTSGKDKFIKADGERLFALNFDGGKLKDGGTFAVKNKL